MNLSATARWAAALAMTAFGSLALMFVVWAAAMAADGSDDELDVLWVVWLPAGILWVLLIAAAARTAAGRSWVRFVPLFASMFWCAIAAFPVLTGGLVSTAHRPPVIAFIVLTGFTVPVGIVLAVTSMVLMVIAGRRSATAPPPRRR